MLLLAAACLAAYVSANGAHDINGNIIKGLAEQELAVTRSGKLGDQTPSMEYWMNKDPKTRGKEPYPKPANRQYNTGGGPKKGMINVHLVPHTHDDTGWQVTVDQYFYKEVYYVIDTVIQNLLADSNRKFIYVETGFFARWWEEANDKKRSEARQVVSGGQLEFINGGWCMHDEASPLWTAMVDQTTRGHQFILKNFGNKSLPRGTWQIDPFGHSNTQAWLLGAEAGMESLFWGRMDYQDRQMRFNKQQGTDGFEWIWQGSKSLGKSAQVFAGDLYGTGNGGYSTWMNFDGSGDQVQDDPARHDYNIDQWVDKFVQDALSQDNHTLSEHQMWACGTDFQYQDADHWYTNLDKLIHYVNLNGTVNAFYSTPSLYTDQKKLSDAVWEVRTDDIFPLADDSHNYWSGYFTSRPALKRQVRYATNFLAAARQLEIVSNTTAEEVGLPTKKCSPPVGTSWTDSLEGTTGVATHHDGMSGTERQDVTDDYEQRISESSFEVEAGISLSFAKLLGVDASEIHHCNCNAAGNCLNMSVCAATTGPDAFNVVAWNPNGQELVDILRIPVIGDKWAVTGPDGSAVTSQLIPMDQRTQDIPLLYLNSFGMDATKIAAAKADLANKATHILVFPVSIPPVGAAVYSAKASATATAVSSSPIKNQAEVVVQNGKYALLFNNGVLTSLTNKDINVTVPFNIAWGWYNSSIGGCTEYPADLPADLQEPACSGQKSGAYIFRSNSSEFFYPGPAIKAPIFKVLEGPMVTEVYQQFSEWASHVIRLYKDTDYIEVEWTAGPIPVNTPWMGASNTDWGKEVVVRYNSGVASKSTFYTDSNGKEMVKRVYNKRGPSYPSVYKISEPVAGNYYPVNAMLSLDDGTHELAVLTDVSQGGSSQMDGSLELMVHRRIQQDDSRGVQEPLNETMCGCNDIGAEPGNMGAHGHEGDGGCECAGLTMRGKHLIMFDTIAAVHEARRIRSEGLNFPSTLAFHMPKANSKQVQASTFTALSSALPPNVKLVTLTSNYADFNEGRFMLRLSHMYEAGEHPTLAVPVTVDLEKVFGKAGLKITGAEETILTGTRSVAASDASKFAWKTRAPNEAVAAQMSEFQDLAFEERVPFTYPTVTIRPMEVRTFMASFE